MHIRRLVAENVKRLHSVDISPDPDDSIVQITGSNEQGKSSLLDSIFFALAGKRSITEKPIHEGETEARIQVELGDGPIHQTDDYVITRTFTEDGGTDIEVKNREGRIFKSPQALLDKLYGDLTFDPLAFSNAKPRDRREMLLQVVKLTLDAKRFKSITGREPDPAANPIDCIDATYKLLFDERTGVGRIKDQAVKVAAEFGDVIEAHAKSASELVDQKDRKATINADNQRQRDEVQALGAQWERAKNRRQEYVDAIAEMQKKVDALDIEMHDAKEKGLALKAKTDKLEDFDLTDIVAQIADVDRNNELAVKYQERLKAEAKAVEYSDEYDTFTARLDGLKALKIDLLREAEFPVAGLGFGDEDVTVNDIPFTQCSGAQSWIVSAAIGMALNPTLRVMLIENGSLLDRAHLESLRTLAKANDYQIWVESVDETGQVGIVIHDGRVVAK